MYIHIHIHIHIYSNLAVHGNRIVLYCITGQYPLMFVRYFSYISPIVGLTLLGHGAIFTCIVHVYFGHFKNHNALSFITLFYLF